MAIEEPLNEPYGGWNYESLAEHLYETRYPNHSWTSASATNQEDFIKIAQNAILWFIEED